MDSGVAAIVIRKDTKTPWIPVYRNHPPMWNTRKDTIQATAVV